MRRVRAADPESAELADVALAGLTALARAWELEGCPIVARFWERVQLAVEVHPVAELQVALDVACGLRDLHRLFPHLHHDLSEVADKIETRAWERERRRLGMPREAEITGR